MGRLYSPVVLAVCVLILSVLIAWLPLLGTYLPVADDYEHIRIIRESGWAGYFHNFGFWRPLGQWLPVMLFVWNPLLPPILALSCHIASTLILFFVCRKMFGGIALPLYAASVFGVLPVAYEAQTWLLANNYLLAIPCFLLTLFLLVHESRRAASRGVIFAGIFGLAFLTNLTNESLFFSVISAGTIVWCYRTQKQGSSNWPAIGLAGAPLLGCTCWFLLEHIYRGASMPKQMAFHLPSVVAVYFRQTSLLDPFQAWWSRACRELLLYGWGTATGTGTVILGVVLVVAFVAFFRNSAGGNRRTMFSHSLAVPLFLMLFGGSLIYVFNGGFSLDSRKKYSLFPLILLGMCYIWRAFGRVAISRVRFATVYIALLVSGIPSTWLVIGIWKHEVTCYNRLADFIVRRHLTGNIQVQWVPDVYKAWPQFYRTMGFRLDDDWVLNAAVQARGGSPVSTLPSQDGKSSVIVFDPTTEDWELASK